MVKVALFHTEGCHLCEMALAMLADIPAAVELRDVVEDSALMAAYQFTIPVVQRLDTGAELGWPFTSQQLEEFLD
ncbi:glutaredoxin family protein [Pseudoalteromonas fenneropenaei]|uniref:Glutaredoxin family protein n=1 Tax=Pseudoalteromonas fenneropenaei TaxID=1737459 RepID=A0ABV7CHU9_9GAMM